MRVVHLGLLSLAIVTCPDFIQAARAASEMNRPPEVVVSMHGLDLSTDAGVAKARARVRSAAERVCGDFLGILPPPEVARCRATAAREADARIAALASRAGDGGAVLASTDNRTRYRR
jgi:UrcA family protein